MDIIVSVFINNKNKNENIKDFHSFCKGKRINFKDNFGNITVSLFVGIGNNISICYKFQNDFNDYFQDKNNKILMIIKVFIQIMMIKINILYILVIL